jgi:hypothetical protein
MIQFISINSIDCCLLTPYSLKVLLYKSIVLVLGAHGLLLGIICHVIMFVINIAQTVPHLDSSKRTLDTCSRQMTDAFLEVSLLSKLLPPSHDLAEFVP